MFEAAAVQDAGASVESGGLLQFRQPSKNHRDVHRPYYYHHRRI